MKPELKIPVENNNYLDLAKIIRESGLNISTEDLMKSLGKATLPKTRNTNKPTLVDLFKMFKEDHHIKKSAYGGRLFVGRNKGVLKPIDDSIYQSLLGDFESKYNYRLKEPEGKYILGNDSIETYNPFKYFLDENRERKKGEFNRLVKAMNIIPQSLLQEGDSFDVDISTEVFLFKKWCTALYNCAVNLEKNDLILALYGEKQGEGKTTLINALFNDPLLTHFFASATIEDSDNFKRLSSYCLLILDDENKSGKKADMESIKKITGSIEFDIVDKYEKFNKKLKRNASFCINSNEKGILKDLTGNRRFLPIEVDKMDIGYIKSDFCPYSFWMDVKDIAESKNWTPYMTSDEIEKLKNYFSFFSTTYQEEELLEKYAIQVPAKEGMLTADIVRTFEAHNYKVNKTTLCSALRAKGYHHQSVRIHGKTPKYWNVNLTIG